MNEAELRDLSHQLGERLSQGDQTALARVLELWGEYVRSNLVSRFGTVLNAEDLDTAVTGGLYRVWCTRDRFDADRASLRHWFYLLARSVALDLIRRRPAVTFDIISDRDSAPGRTLETTPSPAIQALDRLVDDLSEVDRQIVLSFAAAGGEGAWAENLVEPLGMPASTIRSRKRRTLARLRANMVDAGFGEGSMENTSFYSAHERDIQRIARGLQRAFPPTSLTSGNGMAHWQAKWNDSVDQPGFAHSQRRHDLTETYRWLKGRANVQDEYHRVLNDFVERSMKTKSCTEEDTSIREQISRRARPRLLESLELGLAGITVALERSMPEEVRTEGHGELHLKWTQDDALAFWPSTAERHHSLRSTAFYALTESGELPSEEAGWLANHLLDDLAHHNGPIIPHFSLSKTSPSGQPPTVLTWSEEEVPRVEDDQLPEWIRSPTSLVIPSEIETDLSARNPELAEILDRVLCAAALEDRRRRTREEADEPGAPPHVVEEFIGEIARQSGHSQARVAELIGQMVVRQQAHLSIDRAANRAEALVSLWSLLNES